MSSKRADPVDFRRLGLALGAAMLATILLSPIVELAFGGRPTKIAKFVLQLTFLGVLGATARRGRFLEDCGFNGSWARPWWTGYATGLGTLAAYSAFLLMIGERRFDAVIDWQRLGIKAISYLPLAFVIGILEDVFFFGLLWVVLGRRLLPSAAIYAATHFIHVDKGTQLESAVWLHGAESLLLMLQSLGGMVERGSELFGLFLIGIVLQTLRQRSGAIWLSMGVHGGWYWVRMVGRHLSDDVDGSREWLFGSSRFYDGLLGQVAIVITGLIAVLCLRGSEQPGQEPDANRRDEQDEQRDSNNAP